MKKKRIWLLLLLGFILIYLLGNATLIRNNIELHFDHLPEAYNKYTFLNDSVFLKSNLKEIKFESSYEERMERVNDSIICLNIHQENDTNKEVNSFWYKISSNGNIIDSLIFKEEYLNNVDSYLINIENGYYMSWLKNGDTTKKPFHLIENGEILDESQGKVYLKDAAYSNYTYFYAKENDYENKKRFKKFIFYKDNQWFQFYAKDDLHLSVDKYYPNNYLEFEDKSELVHFQKEEWRADYFPSFSLAIHGNVSNYWEGYAFLNLKINNKTLKIKKFSKMHKNEKARYTPLDIYESPNKSFHILSLKESYAHTFYIIKEK